MQTENVQTNEQKQFSISLTFKDKQNYLFTLQSLCNLCKSSLVLSLEQPQLTEHTTWDIFNTIDLIQMICIDEEIIE